ncbi:MAG: 6-phosphofructokinase [Gammaproteobacteria bacterium]|nr:6-phosphofructokinase [Gammaproteobacteria bacterium]MBT4619409.1 6-phosphofructokinase [Gammaproteobacteria bacterium]MBT5790540.1 6-phosphofructokinase [Gammaproteobacteria bacterium]MBT6570421.1 6-phosphofructokinase [Gammaproteobacteria bacterium]MBT6665941.1 6-phosphofructokinase [Gammaproteobacteria bacterium]
MLAQNIFYAQSGGVTAVINATACGVIESARKSKKLGKVLAGKNGIIGALKEELIDTSLESKRDIAALRHTPGGAFGSCRYKLKSLSENKAEYQRLIDVFQAHDIGYFFYNGGGDSQDTANKVSQLSLQMGHPICCIGIPKTVDNDLPMTDTCPGFGSVAKYVAVSTMEAGLDVASMAESSTKIFVLEVMGRHAGWIAAASGLAKDNPSAPPHIILFPEVAFDKVKFLARVKQTVNRVGYCVVVASEGAQHAGGRFLADAGAKDAFGHTQLGGVAPALVEMIKGAHGYKCHWSVADYLQRAARHIASATDVAQAYAVGEAAVQFALEGKNAVMPVIKRKKTKRYGWEIGEAPLSRVANVEKKMPKSFITKDGFGITGKARDYLEPLISGEDYPPYKNGLPQYVRLKNKLVRKRLPTFLLS